MDRPERSTPRAWRLTGGNSPYAWSLSGGTLPSGLSLIASGTISGTPTVAVNSTPLAFTVTDSSKPPLTKSANLVLTISPAALTITTSSLPSGQVGLAYAATLSANGGTRPYTWSLASGMLPSGLSLTGSTGAISGTPTAVASNIALAFKVTDSSSPALTQSANLAITITPGTLTVTTTVLPNGQVGLAYAATLMATGGTSPYTWLLTSGTLTAGLSLNASTGAITGTPTTTATNTPLTFRVTDSSNPVQSQPVNLTLTISPSNITVSILPKRAGLTVTQTLSTLTATTNDNAGVNWSVSPAGNGASFSPSGSLSGAKVSFTAPSSAGVYTITATSVTDTTASASITVGVTDLAGVFAYHNNASRDGVNQVEYALTTSTVSKATFGKLFSCPVDAAVYAQPLWVANVTMPSDSKKHNVVVVATGHDSVYAFDADASPCMTFWQVTLFENGENPVPTGTSGFLAGKGNGDITPETGIIGTPVIDRNTNTIYVVTASVVISGPAVFYQRLHALDLTSGAEKTAFNSPATIAFSGFNSQTELQRAGLALLNGVVYICWASHEDTPPYHGFVAGYSAANVAQLESLFNDTPNGTEGGIWMSGGAPAVDAANNLYVISGNGTYDSSGDYGDSFVKFGTSGGLTVLDSFTPSNQAALSLNDSDLGAGGAAILVDLPATAPHPQLIVGGGKGLTGGGLLFVLDRTHLGGYQQGSGGTDNAVQEFSFNHAIFATAALWQNTLYIAGVGGPLPAFALNPSTSQFATNAVASSSVPTSFGFPGATPSVSADGIKPGTTVVWALNNSQYCTPQSPGCGPAVLYAYDANLTELWDSTMVSGNAAGNAVKFTVPTVANGKVYVGTRGNNTGGGYGSASVSGELDVYGLTPN